MAPPADALPLARRSLLMVLLEHFSVVEAPATCSASCIRCRKFCCLLRAETTDDDRDHSEIRRHRVRHDVGWLSSERRHPGEPRFTGLAMIDMVEAGDTRKRTLFLNTADYKKQAARHTEQQ